MKSQNVVSTLAKTNQVTLSALFIALMSLSGTILKIPMPPPIPYISMQFFFSMLSGIFLGPKYGPISMIIYMILGLIGLPVFTSGGGIHYILMPSFGYVLGFIISSFVTATACKISYKRESELKFKYIFIGCLFAMICVYICGVSYLYIIRNFYSSDNISIIKAIQIGMLIFIVQDTIWCIIASAFSISMSSIIKKFK